MGSETAKLAIADLFKLEEYAERRPAFRREVLARKKRRTVHLGPNMTLLFEDRMLIQYQVQEMLRIERIFEKAGIQEELDAYNPLIPDGTNWKATCLIEYEDEDERRVALARLRGIERRIWVRVGGRDTIFAIADEDMERANEDKTSAVHFLRFELSEPQVAAAKSGAALSLGVDHPAYRHEVALADPLRESLAGDLR
jgi:hypothetical protein